MEKKIEESNEARSDAIFKEYNLTKQKRSIFVIGIFAGVLSQMFVYYATNTVSMTVATELNGMALYSLMFSLGILTQCVLMPIAPNLGKALTDRLLIRIGSVLLLMQAVLCALAGSMEVFLLGRALGGLGNAMVTTLGVASFAYLYPKEERPRLSGFYGTTLALSGVIAPLLTGFVLDAFNMWRTSYIIGIVSGLVCVVACFVAAPETQRKPNVHLDWGGIVSLSVAMVCLVSIFTFGSSMIPWGSLGSNLLIVICFLAFVAFALIERREGLDGVVPLTLFGYRSFVIAFIGVLLATFAGNSFNMYLPAFIQVVMEGTAAEAGMALSIPNVISMVGSAIGGALLAKTKMYRLFGVMLGVLLAIAAFAMIAFNTGDSVFMAIVTICVFYGIGGSISKFYWTALVQTHMPKELVGSATAVVLFLMTFASMIGSAVNGAILSAFASAAAGYHAVFAIAGASFVIVMALCLFLKKEQD